MVIIYQCDKCDVSLDNKKRLKDHMKKEHDDSTKDFQCNKCSYKSVTGASLEQHKRMKHSGVTNQDNISKESLKKEKMKE